MIEHSPHTGIREEVMHLWRNKPLFFTVVAGLAVLLYVLYKHGSLVAPSPSANTTSAQGTPGASFSNTYVSINKTLTQQNTTTTETSKPQPPTVQPTLPPKKPVVAPTPSPGNPIFGQRISLPAPAGSSVQFGSSGVNGQRVYVTLPNGQQYNVFGDASSQLPKGTKFAPGGNHSYWYTIPGHLQAYLVLPG